MKQEYFLSQRLGFTNAQSNRIKEMGIERFLEASFNTPSAIPIPAFLEEAPKSFKELRELRQMSEEQKKALTIKEAFRNVATAHWWLNKMYTDELPLREKMVLFWHNHFVSGFQKVKSSWAMYQQNQLFRDHAFGNFKELTKLVLYNNAMILYLDNQQNKAKAPNENLSRELLELFTLGVGNYTEGDIKEGARALAGLNMSEEDARYYRIWEDNGAKKYLNVNGNLKADDLVEAIFQHPKAAHRLTEKLLKYFVSDMATSPTEKQKALIEEYAQHFKNNNFEIKPFLQKLVRDTRFLNSQGEKIKDPLTFLLQTLHEFQVDLPQPKRIVPYFQGQGMVLLNPPNVKGWDGGRTWLSSQKLVQRVGVIDLLCKGDTLETFMAKRKKETKALEEADLNEDLIIPNKSKEPQKPHFKWDKSLKNNKEIIKNLSERLVFNVSKDMQEDMERILKYDFNPNEMNADQAVLRLAEYIMKSPEFQIY